MKNIVEVLLNKNFWKNRKSGFRQGANKSKEAESDSIQHAQRSQSMMRLLKAKGVNPKMGNFHDPDKDDIIEYGR